MSSQEPSGWESWPDYGPELHSRTITTVRAACINPQCHLYASLYTIIRAAASPLPSFTNPSLPGTAAGLVLEALAKVFLCAPSRGPYAGKSPIGFSASFAQDLNKDGPCGVSVARLSAAFKGV